MMDSRRVAGACNRRIWLSFARRSLSSVHDIVRLDSKHLMVWIAALLALITILLLRHRILAIGLAVIIAIAATVVWFFTAENSARQSNEAAAVAVRAVADPTICVDPGLPVAVVFTNNADKRLHGFPSI